MVRFPLFWHLNWHLTKTCLVNRWRTPFQPSFWGPPAPSGVNSVPGGRGQRWDRFRLPSRRVASVDGGRVPALSKATGKSLYSEPPTSATRAWRQALPPRPSRRLALSHLRVRTRTDGGVGRTPTAQPQKPEGVEFNRTQPLRPAPLEAHLPGAGPEKLSFLRRLNIRSAHTCYAGICFTPLILCLDR